MFFDKDKQLKKEFLEEYFDELGDLECNIKEVKLRINKKLDNNIVDNNLCYLNENSILDSTNEIELISLYLKRKVGQEYLDGSTTKYESDISVVRENVNYIVGILSVIDKKKKTYFNEAYRYSGKKQKNIIAYKFIKLVHSSMVNRFLYGDNYNFPEIKKYKNNKSECIKDNIQLKEYVYRLIEITGDDPIIFERFNEVVLKLGGNYEI